MNLNFYRVSTLVKSSQILNDHILERVELFTLQISFQDVQCPQVTNGRQENAQEEYFI
jgi:hypothetical protein